MNKIDKLVVLDTCIDGDRTKMSELLGCSYDHLMKFYTVCKDIPPERITDIHYKKHDENTVTFDIDFYENIECDLKVYENKDVEIVKTTTGCRVNIILDK